MTAGARRLSKRHVETLLDDYDRDPVGALTAAMRIVLGRPRAAWRELVDASGLDEHRRRALGAEEQPALDELLRDLNEQRGLSI